MATVEAAEVVVTVDAAKVEVVKDQDEEAVKARDKVKVLGKSIPDTRRPDMKTCPHTSPVADSYTHLTLPTKRIV